VNVPTDEGERSTDPLGSLPRSLLPVEAIYDLEDSDAIVQSVPVRGFFIGDDCLAYQAVINLRHRRVVAIHIDPINPAGGWSVVYDSDEDSDQPPDDHSYYHPAHEVLASRRVEPQGSHFENTPRGLSPGSEGER